MMPKSTSASIASACFAYLGAILLIAFLVWLLPIDEDLEVLVMLYGGILLIATGPVALVVGVICAIRSRIEARRESGPDSTTED